jgi:hypothetical protein
MPKFPTPDERREPRRYTAFVNREDRDNRRYYDITDTMPAIRDRALGALDEQARAKLRNLPAAEQNNIFRLKQGSATPLFRSARGGQPILSDEQLLGDDPWVRPVGRRVEGGFWGWFRYGAYRDRVLVEPANADALRGSVISVYAVTREIEEVYEEVRNVPLDSPPRAARGPPGELRRGTRSGGDPFRRDPLLPPPGDAESADGRVRRAAPVVGWPLGRFRKDLRSAAASAREPVLQPHTVRGAFAGALKKKLGLEVTSEKAESGERTYRLPPG